MKNWLNTWLFLITVLLLTSMCSSTDDITDGDDGSDQPTLSNAGQVMCDGQGIANVTVTDGKNITETDQKGNYTLPYRPAAKLIYISSPAGYTVNVVQSVPQFWVNLTQVQDRQHIDFTLKKLDVSDTKHYFIAVGDPQVRNASELELLKPILAEMAATIASSAMNPVHLMVAGDIVFDTPNMHSPSKDLFSGLNQPVYYAIGNHDHVKTTQSSPANDNTADSTFIRHYGPTYYSFDRGLIHYIVLDNIVYEGGTSPVYRTEFTAEQLAWVKKDLSYVSKEKALVVMFHAPSMSRTNAAYGNSADLHALLRGYANVQLISGHTHYNSVADNNGMTEHIVGAVCGGFWEGPVCLDGVKLGYKRFEANGTDIKWEYHDYTDPEAGFSVFKPEATRPPIIAPANELLVNVWDWDPFWQVSYSEDNGETFKSMSRYTEQNPTYDPLAYDSFGLKGDQTVPGRTWIGASKTDHIFSISPSAGVRKILIKAVSRFRTYQEEVEWLQD